LVATGGYLLNIGLYAQQDAEPKNKTVHGCLSDMIGSWQIEKGETRIFKNIQFRKITENLQ
jgi:hypothetical protein